MNDRMSDLDALVDVAARAIYATRVGLSFSTRDIARGSITGPIRHQAERALLAVGLPALLERVEEAEAKVGPDADLAAARRLYEWITEIRGAEGDPDWDDLDVMAQGVWLQGARQVGTDALAAKVAQLREQVAYLERSRDNICETAERDRGDALRELSAVRRAGSALLALKDGPRDEHYYAVKDETWAGLRTALTEGTER